MTNHRRTRRTVESGEDVRLVSALVSGLIFVVILGISGCGGNNGKADDDDEISVSPPPVAVTPPITTPPAPSPPVAPPPTATPPNGTLPPDLRTASVVIEPTLMPHVKEVSTIEATTLPGQPVTFPVGAPGLAIAHNASGAIVALGSSSATSAAIDLSATDSASTLVWIQLGGPLLKTPISEAKARISQAPEFPELVTLMQSSSSLEAGILREPVYDLVDKLIAGLYSAQNLRTAGFVNTGGAASAAATFQPRPDFLPKNLIGLPSTRVEATRAVGDTSNLKLENAGGLEWIAESIPMIGGNTTAAYSMTLPASDGYASFFTTHEVAKIDLPLSPGDQFVRVFQNDDTRLANWKKIGLDATFYALGFVSAAAIPEAAFACVLGGVQASSGVNIEQLTALPAGLAALENARQILSAMVQPTSVSSVFSCAGIRAGRIVNPRFLKAAVDTLLRATLLKIVDGLSLANRVSTLALHHREEHGEQMSVCVANGAVVAEECDVRSTFNVNVVQTGKTVAPPTEVNITVNGAPSKHTIFCEADDSARGDQIISLLGLAATKRITARFMGEDIPAVGTYDYSTGAFDITHVTPRDLVLGNPVVSFYDQQRYRIKGTIDLRTGRIQGTFEDTNIVSWTINTMTKECTSTYSFQGGLAPGSR